MKKRLNINGIANELQGGSAFFPGYEKERDAARSPAVSERARPVETTTIQPTPDIPERPNAPSLVRPSGKRIITRNSFEIYEDQMDLLRQLSYKEKMEGKLGSMVTWCERQLTIICQKETPASRPER
jgi:hypothetical protein